MLEGRAMLAHMLLQTTRYVPHRRSMESVASQYGSASHVRLEDLKVKQLSPSGPIMVESPVNDVSLTAVSSDVDDIPTYSTVFYDQKLLREYFPDLPMRSSTTAIGLYWDRHPVHPLCRSPLIGLPILRFIKSFFQMVRSPDFEGSSSAGNSALATPPHDVCLDRVCMPLKISDCDDLPPPASKALESIDVVSPLEFRATSVAINNRQSNCETIEHHVAHDHRTTKQFQGNFYAEGASGETRVERPCKHPLENSSQREDRVSPSPLRPDHEDVISLQPLSIPPIPPRSPSLDLPWIDEAFCWTFCPPNAAQGEVEPERSIKSSSAPRILPRGLLADSPDEDYSLDAKESLFLPASKAYPSSISQPRTSRKIFTSTASWTTYILEHYPQHLNYLDASQRACIIPFIMDLVFTQTKPFEAGSRIAYICNRIYEDDVLGVEGPIIVKDLSDYLHIMCSFTIRAIVDHDASEVFKHYRGELQVSLEFLTTLVYLPDGLSSVGKSITSIVQRLLESNTPDAALVADFVIQTLVHRSPPFGIIPKMVCQALAIEIPKSIEKNSLNLDAYAWARFIGPFIHSLRTRGLLSISLPCSNMELSNFLNGQPLCRDTKVGGRSVQTRRKALAAYIIFIGSTSPHDGCMICEGPRLEGNLLCTCDVFRDMPSDVLVRMREALYSGRDYDDKFRELYRFLLRLKS